MTDFCAHFDVINNPVGAGDTLSWDGGASTGELVTIVNENGMSEVFVSLITGSLPTDNEVLASDAGGDLTVDETEIPVYQIRYPIYFREDIQIDLATKAITPSANMPALGTTHSFKYDAGVNGAPTVGSTIVFDNGGRAVVVGTTGDGVTGEYFVRLTTLPEPVNDEGFEDASDGSITATVDGKFHRRCYRPLELHELLGKLQSDMMFTGDDATYMLSPDASNKQFDTIIELLNGYAVNDELVRHMFGGSITQNGGDDRYSGLNISVTSDNPDTIPLLVQNNIILNDQAGSGNDYWQNAYNPDEQLGQFQMMVKTRSGGADIDGGRVRLRALEYGSSSFTTDTLLGVGVVSVSLFAPVDLQNTTAKSTVAAYANPTFTEGYQTVDIQNGAGAKPYYLQVALNGLTRDQMYEKTKWMQDRQNTTSTLFGMDARLFTGADLSLAYDNGALNDFATSDTITFGNGCVAKLLGHNAIDASTGTMELQILTGTAPSDNDTISNGSTTADISGKPTARKIQSNFLGQYTGSGFITNYGIVLDPTISTKDDKFADLEGNVQVPPNFVTFEINGLVPGKDYVIAGSDDGGSDFDYDELTVSGAHAANATTLDVTATIPGGHKSSGTIRIAGQNGGLYRIPYTAYSGTQFTIDGTLGVAIDDGATGFISDIDKLATNTKEQFTVIYPGSARVVRAKVRSGNEELTKTGNGTGTLGPAGGSATINRILD